MTRHTLAHLQCACSYAKGTLSSLQITLERKLHPVCVSSERLDRCESLCDFAFMTCIICRHCPMAAYFDLPLAGLNFCCLLLWCILRSICESAFQTESLLAAVSKLYYLFIYIHLLIYCIFALLPTMRCAWASQQ